MKCGYYRSVLSPLIALSFLTLAFFALKMSSSSRVFIFTFGMVSVAGLVTYRSTLRSYKRRRLPAGVYAKNVLLVGRSSTIRWMAQHFRQHVPSNRYQLTGWLTLAAAAELDQADLRPLGAIENLSVLLMGVALHAVRAPGQGVTGCGTVPETALLECGGHCGETETGLGSPDHVQCDDRGK